MEFRDLGFIGVRDLVAHGFSSLGARARGWVDRAPAFRVARCQTWTQVSHLRCLIAMGFGNRTVTFRIDHTPLHRIAVQFEWAEPFGELQKNKKISHFGGMSVFAQKKMCDYQRSSGLVVIRRVARLSRIGAQLMFGPLGHATAAPQALLGGRRAPTAARRPAGGSVRLIFIGGPRFGRPATPIGGGRGYDSILSRSNIPK